jgi:hypothetical protein
MSELKDAVPKLVQRKIMAPKALADFDDDLFRQEADNMLRAMSQAANSTAPYFITSFCVHDAGTTTYDQGLLSQWRGYAKGGFAIEFDEAGIDDLNKAENRDYRYQGIITDSVVYKDYDKKVPSVLIVVEMLSKIFADLGHLAFQLLTKLVRRQRNLP